MALPPQAVERLVREPVRTQGAYRQLVMLSGTLFFITLIIYLGLQFGYRPYLESSVLNLDSQIREFSAEIPLEEQQEIKHFYSALVNLKTLLGNRSFVSPGLRVLDEGTISSVYYTRASLNTTNNTLALTGIAETENDIARQLGIFEEDTRVATVKFENAAALSTGGVQFSATLTLTEETLHQTSPSGATN